MHLSTTDTQGSPVLTMEPDGRLAIIPLASMKEMGDKVNDYLVEWRSSRVLSGAVPNNGGYARPNYLIKTDIPRFGSGEAKGIVKESVRGDDIYIMVDVCNYSLTYNLAGMENVMSPDDHYQDLKRIIAAIAGKAHRLTVIMPFLYEGRQQLRSGRESLDCANMLQELARMGVETIITFDAHEPRIENAIPMTGFEVIMPTYQFIKNILRNVKDIKIDADHLMAISPDEGGMRRAIYIANVLGIDMGMFYDRKDYSLDGNPHVATEFLGSDLEGKDMIIIDDMISSGSTAIDTARLLKEKNAGRIFICATFGIFTNGLERFDKAYEEGLFDRLLTTNLVYQPKELLEKPYYINCDMSKYVALLIDTLNHDASLKPLLDPVDRIHKVVEKYKRGEEV